MTTPCLGRRMFPRRKRIRLFNDGNQIGVRGQPRVRREESHRTGHRLSHQKSVKGISVDIWQ